VDVLDRLQEGDRVGLLAVGLDHAALEAHARVPGDRVGERVGVGLDADDLAGGAAQDVGAVALAEAMSMTFSPPTRARIHS
jgi:hypothetical protein